MQVNDLILDFESIPQREISSGSGDQTQLHPFWRDLESENLKAAIILALVNEIRDASPKNISGEECRTIVARCQAYVSMLDLPEVVENIRKRAEFDEEPSPFDAEFE